MNILKNCSNAYKVCVGSGIALFKNTVFVSIPLSAFLLVSCGASREEMAYLEKSKEVADSVSSYVAGIATDTINGVTHNFIRKANLKCKVKDVLQSTKQIEQFANAAGGYITHSDLSSTKDYSNSIHFKKDSLMERTYYTATSYITMRVPNKQLDSVLAKITDLAVFVDYRTINCDDVKMKLYANKLAENRYQVYKSRLQNKIDNKDAKLNQIADAEENALEKQTMADTKRVESYDLTDQVNYSTVILNLYQAQNSITNIEVLPNNIETYEPSFISKLGSAFLNGFDVLKGMLLFFVNLWSVILILILMFFGIRKLVLHFSKKANVISQA
jgi:hypothetical protein